jgi:phosphatidylserine decarboxylase
VVNAPRVADVREWNYTAAGESVDLKRGDEMGRFLLGSTVVLLFPKPALTFNPLWTAGREIRLGEAMAGYAER